MPARTGPTVPADILIRIVNYILLHLILVNTYIHIFTSTRHCLLLQQVARIGLTCTGCTAMLFVGVFFFSLFFFPSHFEKSLLSGA